MTRSDNSSRMERLTRAMRTWIEERASGATREAILARHPDLREFLEPILQAEGGEGGEPSAEDSGTGSQDVLVGRSLGEFHVLRELGRGGMGVVYEALQSSLDRRVALKVLSAHPALNPAGVARFKREAYSTARLDHPGIVKILAVGGDGAEHWYAMELIDGQPLDAALARVRGTSGSGKAFVEHALDLLVQVADALEHAHRQGIVHRDVKPANVLVRPDGRAVLTDFGLAYRVDLPSVTLPGGCAGTPHYMAPEQAAGRTVDARADVFALGATLYEAVAQRRPFDAPTTAEVLDRIRREEATDPRRHNPDIAPDLSAVVLKALEKDPARRYQTAGAMAQDLRSLLAGQPVQARRPSLLQRVGRWARREPLRAALAGAVLVALGLGMYLARKSQEIQVGAAEIRRAELERNLAFGFLAAAKHEAGARGWFEQARAIAPDEDAVVAGLTLVEAGRLMPSRGLKFLDQFGERAQRSVPLRRLRAPLLRRLGKHAEAEALERSLGPPESPLDLFLAGVADMTRIRPSSERLPRVVLERLSLAARSTRVARLDFYVMWAGAAREVADAAAVQEAVAALLALWRDEPSALLAVGSLLAESDPTRARAAFEAALARAPDSHVARGGLAYLAAQRGDLREALKWAVEATEVRPDEPEPWYRLGIYRSRAGEHDLAMAAYRRAIKAFPQHAQGHANLGAELFRRGDLEGAAKCFRRALDLDPDLPEAHANMADYLYRQGDHPAAEAEYQRAAELDPADVHCITRLGELRARAGDADAAAREYRRAVDAAPDSKWAHFCLLGDLSQRGEIEALGTELRRWTTVTPSDPEGWIDLANYLLHPATGTLRDPATARVAARRAVELSKGRDPRALVALANAEAEHEDPAAAIQALEQALPLAPASSDDGSPTQATIKSALRRARRDLAASGESATSAPASRRDAPESRSR
jgi:tetratricopeptide (TPR) repeat protein